MVVPSSLKFCFTTADIVFFGTTCSNTSLINYCCTSTFAVDWAWGAGTIARFRCIALAVLLEEAFIMAGYDRLHVWKAVVAKLYCAPIEYFMIFAIYRKVFVDK